MYISCNIDGLNGIPEAVKKQLAEAMEAQKGTIAYSFSELGSEIYMDRLVLEMCEEDGDILVVLDIPLK